MPIEVGETSGTETDWGPLRDPIIQAPAAPALSIARSAADIVLSWGDFEDGVDQVELWKIQDRADFTPGAAGELLGTFTAAGSYTDSAVIQGSLNLFYALIAQAANGIQSDPARAALVQYIVGAGAYLNNGFGYVLDYPGASVVFDLNLGFASLQTYWWDVDLNQWVTHVSTSPALIKGAGYTIENSFFSDLIAALYGTYPQEVTPFTLPINPTVSAPIGIPLLRRDLTTAAKVAQAIEREAVPPVQVLEVRTLTTAAGFKIYTNRPTPANDFALNIAQMVQIVLVAGEPASSWTP